MPLHDMPVHEWARRWLAEQWQEWQPRTRASALEALAKFIPLAIHRRVIPPPDVRRYLQVALAPASERESGLEIWLSKNCLPLGGIDRECVAEIDRQLGVKLDGSPAGGEHREPDSDRLSGSHSSSGRIWSDRRSSVAATVAKPGTSKDRTEKVSG